MRGRNWSPPIVLASAMLAMIAGLHDVSPARTLLMAWFLCVAPGLAFLGFLRLSDPWLQAALVPAMSLAIDAAVAGALSYTGLWSPSAAVLILIAISVTG